MSTRAAEVARTYYRAIDGDEYETLREILAPEFVHDRPDKVIEGPDRFVQFMREERPVTATTHEIDAIYRDGDEVAVRGRLTTESAVLFGFVDVFTVDEGAISRLRTYTH